MEAEADFSGYATKANLKCSDGRTIMPDAFKHMDGTQVPLVWQHGHNEPSNVLGHALLEARGGDMYCYAFFNESDSAKNAKILVKHGDINALSIYANRLVERSKNVIHGVIKEVSLVLAGANPGALIDNVNIAHSDGEIEILDDEAVIYTGLVLEHSDEDDDVDDDLEDDVDDDLSHDDETVKDVFNSFTDKQKDVVYFMIGEALKGGSAAHSDLDDVLEHKDQTVKEVFDSLTETQKNVVYFIIGEAIGDSKKSAAHSDTTNEEGNTMAHNLFEGDRSTDEGTVLSHADSVSIFEGAKRMGTLKEAVEDYALKHGIEDIDILFPDAKSVTTTPDFLKRRTEWVSEVMTGTRHTPFSRIKSLSANLTLAEARAKGYVKGNRKQEEFFKVSKRVTTPQTVYKKQKLDRDDILDITDFDVVAWLKGEMRIMLEEEIARAVLIGDGRSAGDDDKISEEHVRPIATDDDLYVTYLYMDVSGDFDPEDIIDSLVLQRRNYRGSGNPTLFTSETMLARMLLIKDSLQRRKYSTVSDLAAALRVSKIVAVEVMDEPDVDTIAIMVNLQDYTIGADKGGDVALFDDFDIDYNQYKYLIETRISGALVKPKSALVVKKVADSSVLVVPEAPTWDDEDKTVTVATTTGVIYKNKDTNATLSAGSPVPLGEGESLTVIAVPSGSGYYISSSAEDEWYVTYDDGVHPGAF